MNDLLARLSALAGIAPEFSDYFGNVTTVSEATHRALLEAMGFDLTSDASIEGAIGQIQAQRADPPYVVRYEDETDLPLGYHTLGEGARQRTLVVAPKQCYLPHEMRDGRIWGAATQLYGVRSERNWGMGDFTDLATLGGLAGASGAGVVGLNPIAELHPSQPEAISPYSPSSRLWLNSAYVDVTAVADFEESPEARALVAGDVFRAELRRVRATTLVDYVGVARLKRPVLELLFASFHQRHLQRTGDARAAEFRRFVREGGTSLERLALYEALTEYFHSSELHAYGWLQWPDAYRSPDAPDVRIFARENAARVSFYCYLQWVADAQLRDAAARSREAGAGLYCDLAVGVDRNGADCWSDQDAILENVSLGAPPDAMNALGQNWGLPPLCPLELRARSYQPLRDLLRAHMRYASVLRIDHVMSLRRTFWIPLGNKPKDGAYVEYPFDDMLAIVALESVLNRCAIVGEDLGTLPDGFRERLQSASILSSRLLYFERDYHGGRFHAPAEYPQLAAASIGTHDLPPLAGWWTGADLTLRKEIGLFPDETSARNAVDERRHARFMLVDALDRAGALDAPLTGRLRADAEAGGTLAVAGDLVAAAYRYLAQTPACLAVVAIEDVLGEVDAVNVPGTTVQHPNWQRKHRVTLEEIARNALLHDIGAIFRS